MAHPRRARQTDLDRRIAEARAFHGLDEKKWSLKAGYSEGYIKQARHAASTDPEFRLSEEGAKELARVVGISALWLRDGAGPMKLTERRPSDPPPDPVVVREPHEGELALIEANNRNPGRFEPRDFHAALEIVRKSAQLLGVDKETAVLAAENFIAAVSLTRRNGLPITIPNILTASLSPRERAAVAARDEELNGEALAELRAQGVEPPQKPVQTPPRGVRAVPALAIPRQKAK